VVERDRIDDTVWFHGGLTNDGGDAGHMCDSLRLRRWA
jgi:hypothetical protein